MAATIEVKYYNSYWLKKLNSIQPIKPYTTTTADSLKFDFVAGNDYFTLTGTYVGWPIPFIGPGQKLTYTYPPTGVGATTYSFTIRGVDDTSTPRIYIEGVNPVTFQVDSTILPYVPLTFGKIINFSYVPGSTQDTPASPPTYVNGMRYNYSNSDDWYVEESRIRGGYNNVSTDYGVKAYIVEESPNQQNRFSSLIYSGLFNSRTGVNNTNQFSVGEDITRTIDPSQGSIQKLYAEDTNLTIFQETKVSRALIDKDAVYSAEGQPLTTSGREVIGQVQAYAGNYGISTNPESFATYGYRKYFTDRNQNAVLRLSQDGITEISSYGMLDYFRDSFSEISSDGKIVGSWDMHNKQYVLSLQPALSIGASRPGQSGYLPEFKTLAFDEDSNGWTSRFSFRPDSGFSLLGQYYTTAKGNVWQHYSTDSLYCNFYGEQYNSSITLVFNRDPSVSKNFQTINYEGSPGWALTSIETDFNQGVPITSATMSYGLAALENQLFLNNFKSKENKYFGNILNITNASEGVIAYGQSMSGIVGFYGVGTFTFPDESIQNVTYNNQAVLFAASTGYINSSY
jgi:hypothetical protein